MKIIYSLSIFIIYIILRCSDTTSSNFMEESGKQSEPIITGIHQTTIEYQNGTGVIFGDPSYNPEFTYFNIVPNPYIGVKVLNNQNIYYPILFTNVPSDAEILIVKGTHITPNISNTSNSSGCTLYQNDFYVVKKILYNQNNSILFWDLRDENNLPLPSGLYRIYVKSNYLKNVIWADLYLIQSKDRDTWIDPTGWLSYP